LEISMSEKRISRSRADGVYHHAGSSPRHRKLFD